MLSNRQQIQHIPRTLPHARISNLAPEVRQLNQELHVLLIQRQDHRRQHHLELDARRIDHIVHLLAATSALVRTSLGTRVQPAGAVRAVVIVVVIAATTARMCAVAVVMAADVGRDTCQDEHLFLQVEVAEDLVVVYALYAVVVDDQVDLVGLRVEFGLEVDLTAERADCFVDV